IALAGDAARVGESGAGHCGRRAGQRTRVGADGVAHTNGRLGYVGDDAVPAAEVEFLPRRGPAAALCGCAGAGARGVSASLSLCEVDAWDVTPGRELFAPALSCQPSVFGSSKESFS